MTFLLKLLLFLVIFGTIVISHEFGHFLLAKAGGIKVNEFYVGMGPTLFHFTKGETKYSLKLFPIGGACMFEGEDGIYADGEEHTEGRGHTEGSFLAASVWTRISTVAAGPIFNFLLAFLLALIVVGKGGSDKPVVMGLMEGYPAQEAGLEEGDFITHINGERVRLYREVSLISVLNAGETLEISYERAGEKGTAVVVPRYDEAAGRYYIGLQGAGEYVECSLQNIIPYGFYEVRYWFKYTLKSLGMIVKGRVSKEDVSGPVGVAQMIGDNYEVAREYGLSAVILTMMNIAILLSVNLGVINLLPLPALDGGRLVFLLVEAVRGKPIPPEKEGMVHFAGFVALMLLMVFVMFNDVMRLFS